MGNFLLNFAKTTPAITWANPANIAYGTVLTSTQLNATTSVGGAWVYSPPAETLLNAGNGQTLSVTFTPTDTTDYTTAAAQVTINVIPATPTFSNLTPSQLVSYGATSVNLGGKLAAGAMIPSGGTVTITAGSASATATVAGDGTFSAALNTQALNASTTPYTISYGFSGTANFATASDESTTLTILPLAQTINFTPPASPVTYGVSPMMLSATASSGLAVSYTVTSGPATVKLNTLTITGAGKVVVAANQAGNAGYAAAPQVTESITVNPASLTVTANNAVRTVGAANPTLTYTVTGFVNGDTGAVVSGTASLATAATPSSPVGTYPITFATAGLASSSYTFNYVNGSLVVYNTSLPLTLWLSPGSTTAGGTAFTLTVNGANFTSNSQVLWNGAARTTTYVNSTQLTATILAQDIAGESTGLIAVANPAPNAGTSPAQPLAVISAAPVATIGRSSIAVATDGSGNHVMTLTGTDFGSASVVQWNGASLATSYVSPWALAATVTAADFATRPATLTVNNPAGTSTGLELH